MPPIQGYRELSAEEIDTINRAKALGQMVGDFLHELDMQGKLDWRWLAIARNELQQGFMALTRAIAKPEGF